MNDYVLKGALIASIIFMGYSISEFVASFKTVNDKIDEFLGLARDNAASESDLRRSNVFLSGCLSVVYAVLAYFSEIAIWLVALIVVKLVMTLVVSDKLLVQVLHDRKLSKKSYYISKYDSLLNAVTGLAFALILVL